jgi:c-di-GMP-binding flagellar brake protein YcgR
MFGGSLPWWRRLVAPFSATPDVLLGGEERRVWVRHPADLKTTCQTAENAAEAPLAAQVRNISQGGISLLVGRCFEPGEMLSIELPGAEEGVHYTVLACVVHVTELPLGQWVLGCTFAREQTDEDLAAFGARRVKHDASDQRTWKRFPTNVTASYQIITAPEQSTQPTQILNISATGIGLLVTQPIAVGALLNLVLQAAGRTAPRNLLVCVVHVTTRGEGEWALGCNFIRSLSENDLQDLLQPELLATSC